MFTFLIVDLRSVLGLVFESGGAVYCCCYLGNGRHGKYCVGSLDSNGNYTIFVLDWAMHFQDWAATFQKYVCSEGPFFFVLPEDKKHKNKCCETLGIWRPHEYNDERHFSLLLWIWGISFRHRKFEWDILKSQSWTMISSFIVCFSRTENSTFLFSAFRGW